MDVPQSRYNNYACLIPGVRDQRIVIGAHHDKIGAGRGTADNWSGLLITYHLMHYFRQHKPRYTLDFVAFAAEEQGMFGAAAYLARTDEATIAAMINIDTIGLRSLLIDKKSAPQLRCLTQAIAESLGYEYDFSNWSLLTGDAQPFLDRDIPVLNIHSVDRKTIGQIHGRRDRAGNVDRRLLDEAYRLVLNVIANLP